MGRKPNNRFRAFEGTKPNDRHIRLTHSMLTSDAWRDLRATSVRLYLDMKTRYTGSLEAFQYPYSEAGKCISRNVISDSIEDLKSHGFISVDNTARFRREANLYRFVDAWQTWSKIGNKCILAPPIMGVVLPPKMGVVSTKKHKLSAYTTPKNGGSEKASKALQE